jgi:short-subunit dehydrogenase
MKGNLMVNQIKSSNNKVALITGASSGMGKEFAKTLLAKGFIVYAVARRTELMKDLSNLGAHIFKLDISNESEIGHLIKQIETEHDGVDVLINNAGFGIYGAVEDIPISDARYQFEVNLFGVAKLTQLVIPLMRKRGGGKIINLSSMGGKIYFPLGAWYHATKHALEGWSDCLRLELAQFNINVVIIEPGVIATDFGKVVIDGIVRRSSNGSYKKMTEAFARTLTKSYQNNGGTDPKVIANLVLKAIQSPKPKSRYVAGQMAKPMMFIRKWFGDTIYDKVALSMVK